jgi:P-type conjugative transfer protein TrbG
MRVVCLTLVVCAVAFGQGPSVAISQAPPGYKPKTDVVLSPTATEAVRVSAEFRTESNPPAPGPDGRVMYTFGAGLATLVCAPMRICILELQPGEKLNGEPQIGDSVRWQITPAVYGAGVDGTPIIVVKPTAPGLDTNLLVTTDRRAYYLRLISKPEDYVSRIAFEYPAEDTNRRWQEHMLSERSGPENAELHPALVTAERLNFSYDIHGGNEHIRPLRVFDDGEKTYLQMPAEMKNREAPVLLIVGNDGKGEVTNYRVQRQTYIVDRLFDRANLVLGAGKKSKGLTVEISRSNKG